MRELRHRFKMKRTRFVFLSAAFGGFLCLAGIPAFSAEPDVSPKTVSVDAEKLKKNKTGLYADIFDQIVYEKGAQFLRLGDLARRLTGKEKRIPARDVNIFDEVPDSLFFTNRQGREPLSKEALRDGTGEAVPAEGDWTVIKGKTEGVNAGFFIKDSTGQKFLLKFDPIDYPELASASESISSRIFYAAGYNVPSYHVVEFPLDRLVPAPDAKFFDQDGFNKPLTKEKIAELLHSAGKTKEGLYRASASKFLKGEILGPFSLSGCRSEDPNDTVPHRVLRTVRALRIMASWVNYYDLRMENTMDVLEDSAGGKVIRHYVYDFGSTLGSAGYGPKPPQFGHEYIFDYRDIAKALFTLGFWEKPWQKRWDENKRRVSMRSAGYFDNLYFNPGKWKPQLPYDAYDELTDADGFWAAKIILSFSEEDLKAIIETGKLTNDKVREYITGTLLERRKLIGEYWFDQTAPLDWFQIETRAEGLTVRATDLALYYGLKASARYRVSAPGFEKEYDRPEFFIETGKPASLPDPLILEVQSTRSDGRWSKKVCLTLARRGDRFELSKIERQL